MGFRHSGTTPGCMEEISTGDKEMNELAIFEFEQNDVRTITDEHGEPWFVARDVCDVLELSDTSMAIRHLDEDEKGTSNVCTPGGTQQVSVISESGLYALIMRSNKPQAKPFRKWVTSEVLPAIRKTGGYITAQPDETPEQIMAKAILIAQDTIARQQAQTDEYKPKVLFADAVSASRTSILVGELSKLLRQNGVEIGQNRLFSELREGGFLVKRQGTDYNMPTQRSMELGLFEIRERAFSDPNGAVRITKTPKVTGKGQVYFVNRYVSQQPIESAA